MPAHCAAERRPLDTMRQQSHFRNRRCLAGCRRRLGRAFALKPAEEASSITLQIGGHSSRDRPPRTVRPPFRLFDPFTAGHLRFQPNGSSTAPVRTSVATEFNSGEHHYDTTNQPPPSIRNSKFGRRCKLGDIQRQVCTDQSCHLRLRRTPLCLLFLISDFGQNFANQPHFSRGRVNLSFRSDCASASRIVLIRPFHVKLRWWQACLSLNDGEAYYQCYFPLAAKSIKPTTNQD